MKIWLNFHFWFLKKFCSHDSPNFPLLVYSYPEETKSTNLNCLWSDELHVLPGYWLNESKVCFRNQLVPNNKDNTLFPIDKDCSAHIGPHLNVWWKCDTIYCGAGVVVWCNWLKYYNQTDDGYQTSKTETLTLI